MIQLHTSSKITSVKHQVIHIQESYNNIGKTNKLALVQLTIETLGYSAMSNCLLFVSLVNLTSGKEPVKGRGAREERRESRKGI